MKSPENAVPFFARFLEGQLPQVQSDLKAGKKPIGPPQPWPPPIVTMKYPSDDDDDPVAI